MLAAGTGTRVWPQGSILSGHTQTEQLRILSRLAGVPPLSALSDPVLTLTSLSGPAVPTSHTSWACLLCWRCPRGSPCLDPPSLLSLAGSLMAPGLQPPPPPSWLRLALPCGPFRGPLQTPQVPRSGPPSLVLCTRTAASPGKPEARARRVVSSSALLSPFFGRRRPFSSPAGACHLHLPGRALAAVWAVHWAGLGGASLERPVRAHRFAAWSVPGFPLRSV